GMKTEITGIKTEITGIKTEITGIKTEITGIKTEISAIKTRLTNVEDGMIGIKNQIDETYEIVKALVEASEVNKAEHDAMMSDIAHIKGNVEKIKIDMYRVEEITANNWAEMTRMKQAR
ncbi:MAG: hypothetical protein U9Q80_08430, partial [Bacillota bacterium]|nr:hypothetical protein [Bacillota bacterium]